MVESGVKHHKHNPRPTVIKLQENFKIALILLDYIFHYSCLSYEEIKALHIHEDEAALLLFALNPLT
jgi:hypothetical protein